MRVAREHQDYFKLVIRGEDLRFMQQEEHYHKTVEETPAVGYQVLQEECLQKQKG